MKRIIFLSATLLVSISTYAQRMVLIEEFTQASCPPCAAQNPAFDALLDANSDKVIAIKYHTSWPGVDPMYTFNPTPVNARVSYYNITGVPDAVHGDLFNSSPSYVTQNLIDNWYNVSKDFDISVIDNKVGNVVDFTVNVGSHTSVTSGSVKVQCVLTEEPIDYNSPPGTNGETEFRQVMRKMFPNATGTNVGTIAPGDMDQMNFSYTIDTNVIHPENLRLVVFLQNLSTQEIYAAYQTPLAFGENHATNDCANPPTITSPHIGNVSAPGATDGNISFTTSNGIPPYVYLWSNGGTTAYQGGLAEGDYTVTVYDAFGCAIYQDFTVGEASANAVKEVSTIDANLFPNPMKDKAVITLPASDNAVYDLNIMDVTGRVVKSYPFVKADKIVIERGNLQSGLYIYKLQSNDGKVLNGKLIVE